LSNRKPAGSEREHTYASNLDNVWSEPAYSSAVCVLAAKAIFTWLKVNKHSLLSGQVKWVKNEKKIKHLLLNPVFNKM
jgi:hypothetical protein